MKAILALLVLSGLILTVQSACSSTACLQLSTSCADLATYISCLEGEKAGCGSESSTAIDAQITAAKTSRDLFKCGGTMVNVSVSTLVISLLAVFLKL